MKKLILLLALSLTICGKAFAFDFSGFGDESDTMGYTCNSYGESYAWEYNIGHCLEWECVGSIISDGYYNFHWVHASCMSCEGGYSPYQVDTVSDEYEDFNIYSCKEDCAYTSSCTIANGSASQYLVSENPCTYGACTLTSCNNGYYKNGNACTACPGGPAGSTVASKNNGMNGISDCYVTGTFSNASGTFEISGTDCTY